MAKSTITSLTSPVEVNDVLANYADLKNFNAQPHEQAWYLNSISAVMSNAAMGIYGVSYQVDELCDIAEEFSDLVEYVPAE